MPREETPPPDLTPLEGAERRQILQVLNTTAWNLSRAAQVLGIDRKTLRTKIDRYGLVKAGLPSAGSASV